MRVIQDCDVLVVGGGSAGLGAAAGAAMSGASVILVEKLGFLGGQATAAMVGAICGLYLRGDSDNPEPVQRGFPLEFSRRLAEASGAQLVRTHEQLHLLPYDPWAFRLLSDDLVKRLPNTEAALHSTLSEVDVVADRIVRAQTLTPDDRIDYRPATVVDCTGNAAVARMAGGLLDERGTRQAPAIVFSVENVTETPLSRQTRTEALKQVAQAVDQERLPHLASTLSFTPVYDKQGRIYLKISLPTPEAEDANWRSRLEREARELVDAVFEFLKAETPAFTAARLGPPPFQVGHRSGPRALGDAILTESDIIMGNRSHEAVAQGAWPLEFWPVSHAPHMIYPPGDGRYDIPYGCLTVRRYHNLFSAGRCLSATSRAMASARVIGTCLATGWAAGRMAAGHARSDRPYHVIRTIQKDWKREKTGIWDDPKTVACFPKGRDAPKAQGAAN